MVASDFWRPLSFYSPSNCNLEEGRDHVFVTAHPRESHPISLSPCVDHGIAGHIDTHTHIHTSAHTEDIFLMRRERLDIRMMW
jgi:hypothetical protein